jgi:hypothetical protein
MKQQLEELLDSYWDAAYSEGREGRTHDTEDGRAQEIRSKIVELVSSSRILSEVIKFCEETSTPKPGELQSDAQWGVLCVLSKIRALQTGSKVEVKL